SSVTANRIDKRPAFFIAHLVSSVIYHAERRDFSNKKCSRTRRVDLTHATIKSRHSLSAHTIVTTRLLTARNGASHFSSGSGNASTLTAVNARKCLSGLFRKSERREL